MIKPVSTIVQNNVNSKKITKKNNRNTINFTGNTERMSKKVYNGFYDMTILFPKAQLKNPISGKLPTFMEKIIKKNGFEIKEASEEIFKTFSEVSDELREFEPNAYSGIDELTYRRKNSTVKKLENVLRKYKILQPYDDFNIVYLDKGGKGTGYKLDGLRYIDGRNEDEFVMKVFHNKNVQANTYHGCFPEINAATYWMKTLGYETDRGKFYWGDLTSAYMVVKYIDEDVRLPKKYPNPEDFGMKFTDEDMEHIHNVCKKYRYDWGGCVVINQVMNSNTFARNIVNKIKNTEEHYKIHDWYKLYNKKVRGSNDSKYAGLAMSIQYINNPKTKLEMFKNCFEKRGKYNDRAMGYSLKFLPHDVARDYYIKLAKSTNDPVLKRILKLEIPMLSVKDECMPIVKDDLIILDNLKGTPFYKYIDPVKLEDYLKLAKQYNIT